jgi:hypothetical protein
LHLAATDAAVDEALEDVRVPRAMRLVRSPRVRARLWSISWTWSKAACSISASCADLYLGVFNEDPKTSGRRRRWRGAGDQRCRARVGG